MADIGMRALGMWQHLFVARAQHREPEQPEARGVVAESDAVGALLQAAIAIDMALQQQGGQLTLDQAKHVLTMLMVARDYVRPLPMSGDDPDHVTGDLQELVDALRLARLDPDL